jgi:hypothetical protein
MTNTYEKIATTTLGSAQATVTFTSITGTYTDLVLITNSATGSNDIDMYIQVNSDTGSNYSWTRVQGSGTVAGSARSSSSSLGYRVGNMSGSNVGQNNTIIQFQNYSNTTTFKTILSRSNNASFLVELFVGLWRSSSAITSMDIKTQSGTFSTGSTFTLYGIKAE